MRICHVLLLLLLCGVATLTLSASVRPPGSDTERYPQQCIINRRKIMAVARRYYRTKYEKQVLLLRQQIHNMKLVERRLREFANYIQRIRPRQHTLKHAQTLRRRRVVRRVVKKKLIRRNIIRPIAKQRRQTTRNHDAQTLRRRRVVKRVVRRHSGGRRMESHQGTRKKKSHKLRSSRIHLRAHMSIQQKLKRVERVHDGLVREMYRTLTFRRRIYRIRQSQRIVSGRVGKIIAKRRALKRNIAEIQLQRRRLRMQLKAGQSNNKIRGMTLRLTHQITGYTRRIKSLRSRQVNLRKRSARLFARLHRLSRRIAVLQKRKRRQLREGSKLFVRKMRLLMRWNVIGPKRVTKLFSTKNGKGATTTVHQNVNSSKKLMGTASTSTEPTSRAAVHRIMKEIEVIETEFRNASERIMHSNSRVAHIRKWIAKLKQSRAKLSSQANSLKGKQSLILSHRIARMLNRQRHMAAKEAEEQKINMRLSTEVQSIAFAWFKSVMKHKLQGFVRSLGDGVRESVKVKKRIIRRKQRRQQRATRKQRLRGIRNGARMVLSHAQHKRISKRIVKRVIRFKKRLTYESRKVAIIHQRKRHITRQLIRLRRRAHRITSRRQRLKRRIVAVEMKCKKLIRRAKQLKLRKRLIAGQARGNGNRISLRRIDNHIKRTAHKVALCMSRTVTPKKRRVQLKLRVLKMAKKRLRLRRRMAEVRRRTRRQTKRLQRLVVNKRRFVRRVVRKKLIRRKVIRSTAKKSGGHPASGRGSIKRVVKSHRERHRLGSNQDTKRNRPRMLRSRRIHIEKVVKKKLIRRKVIRSPANKSGGHSASRIMKQVVRGRRGGRSLGTFHDGHVIAATSSSISKVVPKKTNTTKTVTPDGSSVSWTETSKTQVIHGSLP